MGWTAEGSKFESQWEQDFSPLQVVHTGSGAHAAPYPMGTGALSPEVKRPERKGNHPPPPSAEVKNTWIYTSTPPYIFMA
jgi:hypothetical protein